MTFGLHRRPIPCTWPVSGGHARLDGWTLVAFFVLSYALSWSWMIPQAVSHQIVNRGQGWPTHFPALLGPAVAAFLVLAATTGRQGIADLLRRMALWRVGWRWWRVARHTKQRSTLSLGMTMTSEPATEPQPHSLRKLIGQLVFDTSVVPIYNPAADQKTKILEQTQSKWM